MNFNDIRIKIDALKQADQSFMFKASIVNAVQCNMDLGPYDDEGFEELCNRFAIAVMSDQDSGWPDFEEVAYRAQMLLDDGTYEFPTIECFEQAMANCYQ